METSMLPAEIAAQAGLALILSQSLVNAFRRAASDYTLASWVSPLLALLIGIFSAFLFMLYSGGSITVQKDWTGALIAGVVAGCGAVAMTEFTRSASNQAIQGRRQGRQAVPLER